MHILLISNYYEPDSGAAAVRLSRLAKILHQGGHRITVLTSLPHYPQGRIHEGYRRRLVVTEDRDGIRVIQAWLLATPSPRISRKFASQISFMLTASLRGLGIPRPDVMLIEAQPVFTSLAGVFLAKSKRVPYVLNISDLWPDHLLSVGAMSEGNRLYQSARRLVDYSYRHAAQIIVMSPAWGERVAGYMGSAEKIHTVYNGVDLDRFRPDLDTIAFRQQHNLGTGKLVTFIGTLATQYDFPTMLQAVDALPDVIFAFIGSGSQREILQQASSRPNIRWLDWIDHADIPAAWNASALTFWAMGAHPLYQGTIPAKLYEALACGIPIAAATEGISADILAKSGAGRSVACGDGDGLAQLIGDMLDTPQEIYRNAARRYAEANFDPIAVGKRYEDILETASQKH
jgi:colanic acid biosynthesis glycosyl transferase WcaI